MNVTANNKELSKNPFRGMGVCIQGYEGSFHQVAARYFFGKDVEVIPCDTFRELIRISSDKKQSAGGIMAIENSIAGSILPNYNLLAERAI
jgi:prephenate dehydratase